jgi:hypothetical protein
MIFRQLGDHHEVGQVLSNLGTTYVELQQPDCAAACWHDAVNAMNKAVDREQALRLAQRGASTALNADRGGHDNATGTTGD